MNPTLTKTDFKEFLVCNKCLWWKKKRPEEYTPGEFSLFLQKLIKDGYEVEGYVQKLFPSGVSVSGDKTTLLAKTQELLSGDRTIFQATFETPQGLFAKVDILKKNPETGKWDLYEVKASSEVKTDLKHNYIKDIGFQTAVVRDAGVDVGESYLIYINKDYRRQGEVDIHKLFVVQDVTEEVRAEEAELRGEIAKALEMLAMESMVREGCECVYKSHGQWCDCFALFNPTVPEYSVHHVVQGNKLRLLLDQGVLDVKDIPDDFDLTDIQRDKVNLQKVGRPIIDREAIDERLGALAYPLYFLDYETYGTPIPLLDGYKTNQQIVFQVSIHKLHEDGTLEHFEYLAEELAGATKGLLDMMTAVIGPVGNVVVWYESFEKGRNVELAELHPEHRAFLEDLNARVFDLMKVFKGDYQHPDFLGSASIKKVLPVLLPELSYKSLEIQNGTMALSEWEKMIKGGMSAEEVAKTKANLLQYCALDTMAMVEIFRALQKEIAGEMAVVQ